MMTKKKFITVGLIVLISIVFIVGGYFLAKFYILADTQRLAEERDYLIFNRPTFDLVFSDSLPEAGQIIEPGGQLKTFAALGELEPVTFSIRSDFDLGNVDIEIGDLKSADDLIYSDNIKLFNIKLWEQCFGDNKHCDSLPEKKEVPELLVKDNEQDLVEAERGWVQDEKRYYPPKLNQNFNVKIDKDRTHTFYLNINVPKVVKPGSYSGQITVKPEYGKEKSFDLALEIYNFKLPKSSVDHLIYFDQSITYGKEMKISQKMYQKYLDIIAEAGLDGIVAYDFKKAEWIISQLAERNIIGPYIQVGAQGKTEERIREVAQTARNNGLEPYFYTRDEPNDYQRMKQNLLRLDKYHRAGEKGATAIRIECHEAMKRDGLPVYQELKDEGIGPPQKLDLVNYAMVGESRPYCARYRNEDLISFPEYLEGIKKGTIKRENESEYFYQQMWRENPVSNRVRFGFFLWNSELDGTIPYGFQPYYRNAGAGDKLYDDFDGPRKSIVSVYPSTEGPVKTLQWEGFREGIDDTRYLTKYFQVLERLKKVDESLYYSLIKEYKKKIKIYRMYGHNGNHPWADESLGDQYHQNFRFYIADKIIRVQDVLASSSDQEIEEGDSTDQGENQDQMPITKGGDKKSTPAQKESDGSGSQTQDQYLSDLIEQEEFPSYKDLVNTGGRQQADQDSGSNNNSLPVVICLLIFLIISAIIYLRYRKKRK